MNGNKRNFSLSLWDHNDNFLCNLKSANSNFNGQIFNENLIENVNGEKTLTFSIPMYIFSYESENNKDNFKIHPAWDYIRNEQKIRYTEYDPIINTPIRIEEFVLKEFTETRNGEEKIAQCNCEALAVYELGKVGWSINFDTDYITSYEYNQYNEDKNSNLLTLDYWLNKIFYKETNLGRVSNTTECTYLLQGLQLRDSEGYPIDNVYSISTSGDYEFKRIEEPVCSETTSNEYEKYYNPSGWTWNIEALDVRNPRKTSTTSTLYEEPIIDRYLEVYPNQYKAFSYQIDETEDNPVKKLLPYPIEESSTTLIYATDIKKRLFTVERSNIYSIIQDLCETFKVWAYFNYDYDNSGKIIDRNILFKSEAINDKLNFDFSYGKNLVNCNRIIDSNELITKLIVPDTESSINEGNLISIKEAIANPTGEGYLYNFKYFYENGLLTSGENDENSDEYKINFHCGKIKNYNNSIIELQKYLVPLYDRKNNLDSELSTLNAEKIAIIDNMQSIQEKIDAIPPNQREISSWSSFSTQSNHIGELKTITTTTDTDGTQIYYLNFGRDDIIDGGDTINIGQESYSYNSFTTRVFKSTSWNGNEIEDDNTSNFILLGNNSDKVKEKIYSEINGIPTNFIKAIKLTQLPVNGQSYVRIRYKYFPLAWYYLLLKGYNDQLSELEEKIEKVEFQLQQINNKILDKELNLNNILAIKNEEILQFEKKYKPYIREGYWEANDYQSQIFSKRLDTNSTTSIFEGMTTIQTKLKDLNLNESLHNYSYYFYINNNLDMGQIDIDSISITTESPISTAGGNSVLPRYRGNDYEIFTTPNNKLIVGIAPSLIDTYDKYNYGDEFYKCSITYTRTDNHNTYTEIKNWTQIPEGSDGPISQEKFIYLTNDNIITDSIMVYGYDSIDSPELLTIYEDYTYSFDYAGYKENGTRIDLNDQTSYSTDIYYDYITKITLKSTNRVNKYNKFLVEYSEETTLQYLYQDAVETSDKYSIPQISYNINVINLSNLHGYENYKPKLGQKVPIYDKEMGLNGIEGIITSVSKNLENSEDVQITIATYTSRFEDVFQKLSATVTDVRYNENALYTAADSFTENGTIKEEVFQKSFTDNSYQISLGVNNDINIDKKNGITLIDKDNNAAVKLIGRGIFLTEDFQDESESAWKTGITGSGINASALITGNIDTKNINIWNASEQQIRFIWNEEGLTAYGTLGVSGDSTKNLKNFVDYNKFVRFNYDGLDFVDKTGNITRSALKLGWDGLQIQAQNGALNLDANNGLILKDSNYTRLILGRMGNNSPIYGLRLNDTNGNTSFQSDSNGNLWLAKYINIGGTFNDNSNLPDNPNAGIIGINSNASDEYQMGIVRDAVNGSVGWNSNPIRFWAGVQTTTEYLAGTQIDFSEISSTDQNRFKTIPTGSPTLAKFKVDSTGTIIASGIDVGGWVGVGKYLRSKESQALLRSDSYGQNDLQYPVIAIGKPSSNPDTISGTNYNFRVYTDGSVNITKGNITIGGLDTSNSTFTGIVNTSTGNIAGFTVNQNELIFTNNNYATAVRSYAHSETPVNVFEAGPRNNPNFYVTSDGSLTATNANISGSIISSDGQIGGFTIKSSKLYNNKSSIDANSDGVYIGTDGISLGNDKFKVTNAGELIAKNANITGSISTSLGQIGGFTIGGTELYNGKNSINANSNGVYIGTGGIALGKNNFKVTTDGKVTANDIYFNGTITARYSNADYTGVTSANIQIPSTNTGYTEIHVVKGLIVGR